MLKGGGCAKPDGLAADRVARPTPPVMHADWLDAMLAWNSTWPGIQNMKYLRRLAVLRLMTSRKMVGSFLANACH
jgi:hypothetical protein